jgi:hypothetical protein
MLGTVIHNFPEPGVYLGSILVKKEEVGSFRILVDAESQVMGVNIDLALLDNQKSKRCDCQSTGEYIVNPKGYTQFFVSNGPGGYSVVVGRINKKGKELKVFDSQTLKKGDIFAVTMIRPGTYTFTNTKTKDRGEIVIAYPKKSKVPYRAPNPVSIECAKEGLSKKAIKISAAQGIVYTVNTPTRIKIDLVKPDDGPKKGRKRKRPGWKKQVTRRQMTSS